MFWSIFIFLLLTFALVRHFRNRKFVKLFEQLKCKTKPLPIIGHAHKFFGNEENIMKGWQHFGREAINNEGMSFIFLGEFNFVGSLTIFPSEEIVYDKKNESVEVCFYVLCPVFADPGVSELILKTFMEKSEVLRFVRFVTGNGSIFAPVSIWRPRRKILVPTFSPRNLTQFVRIFAEQSNIMTERLRSAADEGPVAMWNYLNTYSFYSICESAVGISGNMLKSNEFVKEFEQAMQIIANRIVSPWMHNDAFFRLLPSGRQLTRVKNYLLGVIDNVLKTKTKLVTEEKTAKDLKDINGESRKSFIDLLIKSSEGGYTNVMLREETLVLLVAGTDTSAVGTGFTSLMLARHPDIQEKVYNELKMVFGDSKRPVEPEDLPQLKYLEAVIKETLRLYPPVPIIARHASHDFTLPSGVTLVEGCVLLINIWAVHRNPRYWGDDAELFRPERFLNGATLRHPAQFMPFSYGSRNCVGYKYAMMSITTAVATLLRSYRVLPTKQDDIGSHTPLRVRYSILMKDVNNFALKLESRN